MDYICLTKNEITDLLKETLDEERYIHSLATADTARALAQKYGENPEKAYLAGLLHDCAKCYSKESYLEFFENGVEITQDEKLNPKTFHAPVGAYIAKTIYKVTDDEILSAIRWHTVGKVNMSIFEKIIFLADKIEPKTRPEEYRNTIIKNLDLDYGLDRAILECYKHTINHLSQKGFKICTSTIDVYNELLDKIKG